MKYCIGIDMGGTNTDMGLVDEEGHIAARRNMATNQYSDFALYVKDLTDEIKRLMADHGVTDITGIGIGAPNGNYYTGCIDNAPNLKMKGVLNFGQEIHRHLSVPVTLSNDANAATVGEMIYGGAKGMKNFVMLTLGTGVGSGIVVDGKLVLGKTSCAGELGHSILIPEGRLCNCGRRGCLEEYASARGIVQTYCELRADMEDDGSELYRAQAEEISCKMIGDAANAGYKVAAATYERTGYYLGIGLSNAVTFTSPEAIFLMGGPTLVGEPLMRPLRQSFEEHLLNIFRGTCSIQLSQLKANEVAILGAAALVNNR